MKRRNKVVQIPSQPQKQIILPREPEPVPAEPFFLSNRLSEIASLAILIILLTALRLVPTWGQTIEYKFDSAFNYRMTRTFVESGSLPAKDMLSIYPDGKDVKRLLPCTMYYVVGWGYRILNTLFGTSLERAILYMTAASGSLIVIPIYLMALRLYRRRWIAFACAGLAGIMPGYLNRTAGYCYRFEPFGLWLNFMSLYFFIEAYAGRKERSTVNGVFAGAFFVLALAFWRLSLVMLIVYVLASVYALVRGVDMRRCVKILGSIIALYILSIILFSGFGSTNPVGDYGSFPKALFQILMARMGSSPVFDDFTRIAMTIQELDMLPLKEFFGYLHLSFSGIFVIIYFASLAFRRPGDLRRSIVAIALGFYLFLTYNFLRNKIFIGPLAALAMGEVFLAALRQGVDIKKKAVYLVILCVLARTAYDSGYLILTRGVNISLWQDERDAFRAVNEMTPAGSAILTYWSDGYHVQTYCARPVITDGFFEYPENIRRLVDESKAVYSFNEGDYWDFCRRYHAGYLLVLKNRKRTYAMYAGLPYAKYFDQATDKPTPIGRQTVLAKLIFDPSALVRFERIYENKSYQLFRIKEV